MDSENNVFKEPFFPVSSLDAQGYFDIIGRRDRESNSSTDKFTTVKKADLIFLGGY